MNKDELKHFRKGVKDVQRTLTLAMRRLNEGRYESAAEFIIGESVSLKKLGGEMRDYIETKDRA